MSNDTPSLAPPTCPTCGGSLDQGEMCPRCLIGDVLAVLDGPTPPKSSTTNGSGTMRKLGEYELLEELGRGGMGVVWKARQRRLNRVVALKLVRGGCLPGEAAAKRFRREAEAAAQLKHPNIVVIHEVGEFDDQLYLSMDLVEGGSLADWLKRVAFSPRDTAMLIAKVARGVHHAHENQVLHRDLKPGNILLNAAGEPRVCDFGLARLGDSESSLTISGELLGTPAYLSPEQAAGKMRDLTFASDTYSLGAILYELLCGHPPFSADNLPALLRKVAEDDPMRPISHYSGGRIPYDLSTICLKCLEKEPKARYQTALELAEDLERWLRGEPIVARPVARVERVWKWIRRKPVLAALWLVITALLVVVAVVSSMMSYRLERERRRVTALAQESRYQVARQHSESAQRYMGAGDYLRALPALAEAISIGTGNRDLDEADRIRFGVLLRSSPQLAHAWLRGDPVTRAEATQDGTRLLVTTETSAEVWNTATGQRIGSETTFEGIISNAQFDTMAGRWALFEVDSRLTLWEPDTGNYRSVGEGHIFTPPDAYMQRTPNFIPYDGKSAEVRALAHGQRVSGPFEHEASVHWATLLPGWDRALTSDEDGRVYLWNLTTGALAAPALNIGKGRTIAFDAYHPEKKIAAMHREKECWLLDCQSGVLVKAHKEVDDSPQTIGWDERGNWRFLARNNEGLTLRKMEDDTIVHSWMHDGLGFRGSFAPAAGLVATQSWNGSTRVWRLSSGRPATPFLWQTATPGSCILDPQGRWLLTRGDEPAARLWRLPAEGGAAAISENVERPTNLWLALNPERLFVADANGNVRAWEKEAPQRKAGAAKHPERQMHWAASSEDGRRFFTAGSRLAQTWDGGTLKAVGKAFEANADLSHATIDSAGRRLGLVLANGEIVVWAIDDGTVQARFHANAKRVAFSPDGTQILAMGDKSGRTWSTSTGHPISEAVDQTGGDVMAKFSPDGRRVVQWSQRSSPGQYRAKTWEAKTGRVISELASHWLGVSDAAWSPNGKSAATVGADQTLLLCDVETGLPVLPPIKHPQKVSSVGFSKDGQLMWSTADREVSVWHSATGEPVAPRWREGVNPLVAFGSDGRTLAVASRRSEPKLWDFRPELRSADELRTIAHALSSHALVDGSSALKPLFLMEVRNAWENARKTLGGW